jgi:hypothetical protein
MYSGRVCVPVRPKDVWSFDPSKVPTVHSLLQELEAVTKEKEVNGEKAHHAGRLSCNFYVPEH